MCAARELDYRRKSARENGSPAKEIFQYDHGTARAGVIYNPRAMVILTPRDGTIISHTITIRQPRQALTYTSALLIRQFLAALKLTFHSDLFFVPSYLSCLPVCLSVAHSLDIYDWP